MHAIRSVGQSDVDIPSLSPRRSRPPRVPARMWTLNPSMIKERSVKRVTLGLQFRVVPDQTRIRLIQSNVLLGMGVRHAY